MERLLENFTFTSLKIFSPNLQLYKILKGCSLGQKCLWKLLAEVLLYIVNSKILGSVKNLSLFQKRESKKTWANTNVCTYS